MHQELQESFSAARRSIARGDYSTARRELEQVQNSKAGSFEGLSSSAKEGLAEEARTIEVLESIDVLRKLLRDGNPRGASGAAGTILDALSADEYSRLGIIGAALTLIGRARELAVRSNTDSSRSTREEIGAFVDYMGTELHQLERDCLNPSLESIINGNPSSTHSATLGDLLSRRPWKASANSAVQPVLEPTVEPSSTQASSIGSHQFHDDASPVIGRILIEQEAREQISTQPQTATSSSGRGTEDIFEVVLRAVFHNWWVVLSFGLIFSAIGWLVMVGSPTEWQAESSLFKSETSEIRAPVTGEPLKYMSHLPAKAVLQQANSASFHMRVSRLLKKNGYAPRSLDGKSSESVIYDISAPEVSSSLSASLTSVSGGNYNIIFTARHSEPLKTEAIASAAADAFVEFHREQLINQTKNNMADYERLLAEVERKLALIKKKKLDEFKISETQAIGVTLEERIKELLGDLKESNTKKEQAQIDIDVSLKQVEYLQQIADRIPMYNTESFSTHAQALELLLTELRKEYYTLARKRSDFGPDHPIQTKISELHEDIQLHERELEEVRTGDAADLERRNTNPARAQADENVAMAKSSHHDALLRLEMESKRISPLQAELDTMRRAYHSSQEMRTQENSLLERRQNFNLKIEEMAAVGTSAGLDLALLSPDIKASKVPANTLVGLAVGLILGLVVGIGVAIVLLRRRQVQGT